jgi:hypothetical protein
MQAYEIFKTLVGFRVRVNGEAANDNKPFTTRAAAEAFVAQQAQAQALVKVEIIERTYGLSDPRTGFEVFINGVSKGGCWTRKGAEKWARKRAAVAACNLSREQN